VVGPRLKILLSLLLAAFAIMSVNSVYLVSITLLDWLSNLARTGLTYKNYFHVVMFGLHIALGLLIVVPLIVFGVLHIRNARNRPNRRAVRAGYALFVASLVLLFTGIILTRIDIAGVTLSLRQPALRGAMYWIHVIAPLAVVWLFILHRLAGRRIKWKVGVAWASVAAVFALVMTVMHSQDPKNWNQVGPAAGTQYFFPSLVKTATGNFIDGDTLMMDQYCMQCHQDIYDNWFHSAHHFSSFSNPAYLFSVRETRKFAKERDGNVQASRWCAGCHDPVPFLSGRFEESKFDDPNYDLASDPMASAGITCTTCHAITHVNSTKGNADFTIEEPTHYPFARSENPILQWINQQLVKAQPALHKKTFLKPLHKTAEFCSTCHKVHLPPELNDYKWLRGQNHYDSFLLSGVSGHGIQAWYYPPKAEDNCSSCHMPLMASDSDFGAKFFEKDSSKPLHEKLTVHDHLFPSANTAVNKLLGSPEWVNAKHDEFMKGFIRVDLFALRDGATFDAPLIAPLRPEVPTLEVNQPYLLDAVVRTLRVGHPFTQGTVDSNEVWLDVKISDANGHVIGRSGGLREGDGEVDPWSHFVNVYMLDRHGNRIDRRNPQDIFTPLYNHQIPPGAADVIHYAFTLPAEVAGPITIEVDLKYRKFDTKYMRYFQGEKFATNDLPISILASDKVTLAVEGSGASISVSNEPSKVEPWQRWNDYGIGLFRKGDKGSSKGELRQAEMAFSEVEKLGRPDGPLNRARVYIKEGRLDEAVVALNAADKHDPPAPPWSVAYFTGLVNKQNGHLDDAIANFQRVVEMKVPDRDFDFSYDYTLLDELGQTIFERAQQERGEARKAERERLLNEAKMWFEKALAIDSEDLSAHHNLALIYAQLGDEKKAKEHRELHAKYKPDDNATDRAIGIARRNDPAANHAAEAVVIYDLQREGAYGLTPKDQRTAHK
jgi:tetratricopeptide (TPR) repeat protein